MSDNRNKTDAANEVRQSRASEDTSPLTSVSRGAGLFLAGKGIDLSLVTSQLDLIPHHLLAVMGFPLGTQFAFIFGFRSERLGLLRG